MRAQPGYDQQDNVARSHQQRDPKDPGTVAGMTVRVHPFQSSGGASPVQDTDGQL